MTSKDETLPDRLREAADRVSRHCFRKAGDDTLMSIPARPGYDVDLLLGEAADEIERLDGLWRTEKARADFNFEENERLRAALAMVYDKWEDGDPCYEDADPMGSFMGNAFKLSEAEENQILALLPRERGAAETPAPQSGEPNV